MHTRSTRPGNDTSIHGTLLLVAIIATRQGLLSGSDTRQLLTYILCAFVHADDGLQMQIEELETSISQLQIQNGMCSCSHVGFPFDLRNHIPPVCTMHIPSRIILYNSGSKINLATYWLTTSCIYIVYNT